MAKSTHCGYRKHARCSGNECDCRCHGAPALAEQAQLTLEATEAAEHAQAVAELEAALQDAQGDQAAQADEGAPYGSEADDQAPEALKVPAPAAGMEAGSQVVWVLEWTWAQIRARFTEVPSVVIVTGSGLSRTALKFGHFGADRWRQANLEGRLPELMVTGESLAMGAKFVLETMLHEAAHALATVRGEKATSGQSLRYHNRKFRALAEELGLEWPTQADGSQAEGHPNLGYSEMLLLDLGCIVWADVLDALGDAIMIYLDTMERLGIKLEDGTSPGETVKVPAKAPKGGGGTAAGANRNRVKGTCPCGRNAYAAPTTWAEAPLICGKCHMEFLPVTDLAGSDS